MSDGERRLIDIYRYVTGLGVTAGSAILGGVAIYCRQIAANWNCASGSDRHRCASRREDDPVKRCVATVDLRVVGPSISLVHDVVHDIIPYAAFGIVADDIAAMSKRRLRREELLTGYGVDIAVRKGADI